MQYLLYMLTKCIIQCIYLSIRALAQNLQQFKLRWISFFKALFHMMTDVEFFQNTIILQERQDKHNYIIYTVLLYYQRHILYKTPT